VFDFELDAEDSDLLAGMNGVCGYSADPDKTNF
jgi:hypothetical protein